MQKMQRKMGTFLKREADDHQVGMLIHDFNSADKMLETLINASEEWKNSWNRILTHQSAILSDYENLYGPIIGMDSGEKYTATPQDQLEKVHGLKTGYIELKDEMLQETAMIDKQIIAPAREARISVKAYMKVIRKREDKKLDYERYKSRVEKLEDKSGRSQREDTALGKHQIDYASAKAAYEAADDHLKQTLPNITHATYSLLPYLLESQIMIQNALLGQLYTTMQGYCGDYGIPSNPPESDEVIRDFEATFTAMRNELESSIMTIYQGKAVKEPYGGGGEKSKSYTGLNIRNGIQGKRTQSASKTPMIGRPLAPAWDGDRSPQSTSGATSPMRRATSPAIPAIGAPAVNMANRPKIPSSGSYAKSPGGLLSADTMNGYRTPSPGLNGGPQNDYFAPASHTSSYNESSRRPSAISLASSNGSLSSIASKKKPPPPPPKRKPSYQIEYVTAIYDFTGQSEGDLSFREGDEIKIVKKTDSTNDWWEGEIRGVKGSFPANYCR